MSKDASQQGLQEGWMDYKNKNKKRFRKMKNSDVCYVFSRSCRGFLENEKLYRRN